MLCRWGDKNKGKSEEQLPQKTVGRLLANSRPTVGQQLANSRMTVGRQSADCWPVSWPTVYRQTFRGAVLLDYLRAILTPREHRKPQKSRTKIHFSNGYTLSTRN